MFITVLKLLTGFPGGVSSYLITVDSLNYRSVRLFALKLLFKHAITEKRYRASRRVNVVLSEKEAECEACEAVEFALRRGGEMIHEPYLVFFVKVKLYSALFIYAFYNSKSILD